MFAHGQAVMRRRARQKPSTYSPQTLVPDWSQPPVDVPIEGGWVASSSSASASDATRTQIITQKSLYCDPGIDVQPGDRIVSAGVTYEVETVPQADRNPFTGWQPVQEIPLKEVRG